MSTSEATAPKGQTDGSNGAPSTPAHQTGCVGAELTANCLSSVRLSVDGVTIDYDYPAARAGMDRAEVRKMLEEAVSTAKQEEEAPGPIVERSTPVLRPQITVQMETTSGQGLLPPEEDREAVGAQAVTGPAKGVGLREDEGVRGCMRPCAPTLGQGRGEGDELGQVKAVFLAISSVRTPRASAGKRFICGLLAILPAGRTRRDCGSDVCSLRPRGAWGRKSALYGLLGLRGGSPRKHEQEQAARQRIRPSELQRRRR